MTKKEIRTQLKAAFDARDAAINFADTIDVSVLPHVFRRLLYKKGYSDIVSHLELQAGSAPNYNIIYKS